MNPFRRHRQEAGGKQVPLEPGLILYQTATCPYCFRVRRALGKLGIRVESRNPGRNPSHRNQLLRGGGKLQVPCLRIRSEDGRERWLYESRDIIDYLQRRFARQRKPRHGRA